MIINRRQFIKAGAGTVGATLVGCQPVPSTSLNLDLDDPVDRLTALAKLRGSVDGAPVMW